MMCQGEDAPNPGDAGGTSRYGGGAPPLVSAPASTTTEEGFTEAVLRTEKSDYENYDSYSSDDDILDYLHVSQDVWDENDGNSSDSSEKELGDKEGFTEAELRIEKSDYENFYGCSFSSDDDIPDDLHIPRVVWDGNDGNSSNSNGQKLGVKGEPIEALFLDFNKEYDIFRQKIILLNQKYEFFRTARDGNCFYRGFIFNYLELVAEMQDGPERRNEVTHLRRCVENIKQAYESFGSLIDESEFLAACDDFEYLLDLIQNGISAGNLYLRDCKKNRISRILPLLRFLVMIELCTRVDFYYSFVCCEEDESIYEFCLYEVIPDITEASHIQIIALVNALGVPLILENLDTSLNNGVVKLNQTALCPRPDVQVSEVKEFELQSSETCSSSSTSSGERTVADLSPAERRRLVTLLYRPGHYDILYPK